MTSLAAPPPAGRTRPTPTRRIADFTGQVRPTPARLVIVAALISWLVSLPSLGHARASQFGLLAAGSPLFVASIGLTAVGFILAARRADLVAAWGAVLMSIMTLRVTISVATEVPFYSWTYKHLSVVEYIRQHGAVARDVDIYNHWNGLFAGTAWLSDVSGISPISLAHWFTPAAYLLEALLFYAVARTWNLAPMTAIVATFLVENLDWVGQSYFSPQCTAYLLALAIIGLLGLGLRSGRCSRSVIVLSLGLFAAITVTHQLTPYWLILLTLLLTFSGRLRPRWLPIAFALIALGFLAYNWSSASHFGLLSGGNPVSNAQTNIPTVGVYGQQLTSNVVRLLSGLFWLSALACAVKAMIRRQPFLIPTILAFSSFGILLGQGYGGEAVFRVFLFSLPGCAMLVAPAVERLAKLRFSVWPLAALAIVASVASAQGLFGAWSAYRMPAEEVALSAKLIASTKIPSFITAAAPVWPERNSSRYVDFARWNTSFDITMVYAAQLVGSHFNADAEYAKFMQTVVQRGPTPTYLVITKQMQFYDWYFGILPYDAIPNLQARIDHDPRWKPYYVSGIVHIYELVGLS